MMAVQEHVRRQRKHPKLLVCDDVRFTSGYVSPYDSSCNTTFEHHGYRQMSQHVSEPQYTHGTFAKKNAVVRTKYCESWLSGKTCRFGARCWYAHGPAELTNLHNDEYTVPAPAVAQHIPTQAQIRWMMLSQQSEAYQAHAHQAILSGQRLTCDSHANTTRVRHPQRKQSWAESHPQKEKTIKPLLELLMDAGELPLRTNDPASFKFDDENNDHLTEEAANVLSSLHFMQSEKKEKSSHGICDIYAISGFCPLGSDCSFYHTPRLL